MNKIRNLFSGVTSSSAAAMGSFKVKTPPAPTVESAIKGRQEVEKSQGQQGGEGTETAVFANGCFVSFKHERDADNIIRFVSERA